MDPKNISGLCIAILIAFALSEVALAVSVSYETSSVSRIVGDNPDDLINQLDSYDLSLNRADYYGDQPWFSSDSYDENSKTLKGMFSTYSIKNSWDYTSIATSAFKPNEFFIIEADSGAVEGSEIASYRGSTRITPKDVKSWKADFSKNYPVFLFDSDYAGLNIPGKSSFVSQFARYSDIIAPSFTNSREFVRAFICNIGDGKTLGNTFREARNKYYETVNPSEDEMIGITLMSYHLFGNPLTIINTQKYDESLIKEYCKDLLGEKEDLPFGAQEFSTQSSDMSVSGVVPVVYDVVQLNGFDIINATMGESLTSDYSLVLPSIVKKYEFPKNTIITNVSYQFLIPDSKTLNIAEYSDGFRNRSCYSETQNQSLDYSVSYKDDKIGLNIYINPVQVLNCTKGLLNIYKSVQYTISYIPYSPIYFDNISYPSKVLPGQSFNISVTFKYVNNTALTGDFALFDGNNTLYKKETNLTKSSMTFPMIASENEGLTKYILRYSENNITLSESEIEIESRLLDYILDVPEVVEGTANVLLQIYNHNASQINISVSDSLLLNDQTTQGQTTYYILSPGLNNITYAYASLLQSNQRYSIIFNLGYMNKKETITNVITTNHPPLIDPIDNPTIRAGDFAQLNISATDLEGDSITYTISSNWGTSSLLQTTKLDNGTYYAIITASDGLASSQRVVNVFVTPYNRIPVVENVIDFNIAVGDAASVFIYASDEDGDNLIYGLNDSRFAKIGDSWFEWVTNASDAGNYSIMYSVDDGRSQVSGAFGLSILSANLTNITNTTTTNTTTTNTTNSTNNQTNNSTYFCIDGDLGFDSSIKTTVYGLASWGPFNYTDSCLDSTHVEEWHCSGSLPGAVFMLCSYGCSDGICLSSEVNTTNATNATFTGDLSVLGMNLLRQNSTLVVFEIRLNSTNAVNVSFRLDFGDNTSKTYNLSLSGSMYFYEEHSYPSELCWTANATIDNDIRYAESNKSNNEARALFMCRIGGSETAR